MPMFKRLKRKEIFEVVRSCVVSSPAANGNFLRSAVDEYTRLEVIGITSYADLTAVCLEVGRKLGYFADCSILKRNMQKVSLGDIVNIFQNAR